MMCSGLMGGQDQIIVLGASDGQLRLIPMKILTGGIGKLDAHL